MFLRFKSVGSYVWMWFLPAVVNRPDVRRRQRRYPITPKDRERRTVRTPTAAREPELLEAVMTAAEAVVDGWLEVVLDDIDEDVDVGAGELIVEEDMATDCSLDAELAEEDTTTGAGGGRGSADEDCEDGGEGADDRAGDDEAAARVSVKTPFRVLLEAVAPGGGVTSEKMLLVITDISQPNQQSRINHLLPIPIATQRSNRLKRSTTTTTTCGER